MSASNSAKKLVDQKNWINYHIGLFLSTLDIYEKCSHSQPCFELYLQTVAIYYSTNV